MNYEHHDLYIDLLLHHKHTKIMFFFYFSGKISIDIRYKVMYLYVKYEGAMIKASKFIITIIVYDIIV